MNKVIPVLSSIYVLSLTYTNITRKLYSTNLAKMFKFLDVILWYYLVQIYEPKLSLYFWFDILLITHQSTNLFNLFIYYSNSLWNLYYIICHRVNKITWDGVCSVCVAPLYNKSMLSSSLSFAAFTINQIRSTKYLHGLSLKIPFLFYLTPLSIHEFPWSQTEVSCDSNWESLLCTNNSRNCIY